MGLVGEALGKMALLERAWVWKCFEPRSLFWVDDY